MTRRVLPVPPIVILPTTMTGTRKRVLASKPRAYMPRRRPTTVLNTAARARNQSAGLRSPYQIAFSDLPLKIGPATQAYSLRSHGRTPHRAVRAEHAAVAGLRFQQCAAAWT